jgi:hypothetical protein
LASDCRNAGAHPIKKNLQEDLIVFRALALRRSGEEDDRIGFDEQAEMI